MEHPVICTIIAKNYLAQARCLTESFLKFHPQGKVFVLVVDEINGKFDPRREKFETVQIRDLDIPRLTEMVQRYTVAELCTAVKPFLLEYLFEKRRLAHVCYFDPDIYFYGPIDSIWKRLQTSAIILTPHILGPLDEERRPNEFTVFQAGIYNLGFLGLAHGAESEHLLPWWQERLITYSHNAPEKNEHYDQKWMDLIPGFYESVLIDRNPGHNMAYWDFSNRRLTETPEGYRVNGQPLIFFHFSGYDPRQPEVISKYQDRFTFEKLPELKNIFDEYGKRLLEKGFLKTSSWSVEIQAPTFAQPTPRLWRAGKDMAGRQGKQVVQDLAPWLYRQVTSGLAAAGLEKPLIFLLGRKTIGSLQRAFLRPGRVVSSLPIGHLAPGINVVGFLDHAGGVGEVARRSVRALAQTNTPVTWTNLGIAPGASVVVEDLPKPLRETLALNMWHVNADILPGIMAQHGSVARNGAINVAYWAWELPQFPVDWANRKSLLNEVWVGSSFVKAAVQSQLDIPVKVLGAPIEKILPTTIIRRRLGLPADKFMFLFIFDFASYIERKNPYAIIEAYRQAFGMNSTDTILVMKVLNAHTFPKQRHVLREQLESVGGRMIEDVLEHADMQALIANCDAYVSLHRSEGFGVTVAEAMMYSKPAIATNYSGNTDYMNEENSYPITYQLIKLNHDIGPYRAGGTWADPDVAAAARAMRDVVNNQEEAQKKGARAARDVEERYGFAAFAKRMQERLQVLTKEKVWQRVLVL
ncbi:MAG: glycosyltransferase family 4 protein [Patescibacteria group bacterium]